MLIPFLAWFSLIFLCTESFLSVTKQFFYVHIMRISDRAHIVSGVINAIALPLTGVSLFTCGMVHLENKNVHFRMDEIHSKWGHS